MAGPLLLSDNLYNTIAYPAHVLTADEQATGHEIQNIADGRRSPYDYWTPTTANAAHNLMVTSNQVSDRSFESGTGDASATAATIAQDATQHQTGTKSLKVTTTNVAGSGFFLGGTKRYTAVSGGVYTFAVSVTAPLAVGKTIQLSIEWYDSTGTRISTSNQASFALSAVWATKNYQVTAPTGTVAATPTCYTDAIEGIFDFYADDASFGQSFAPTAMFLDRGHNITGFAGTKYQYSYDGITWSDVWSVAIPGVGVTDLTSANGCTTEEGAWGKVWAPNNAASWHRLLIPAMGTGRVPVVVGLWLGVAYQPAFLYMPSADDGATFTRTGTATEWGWRGGGPRVVTHDGTLNIRFDSAADYATARPFLVKQFAAGRPMWVCHDQAQADRSVLTMFPDGARIDPRFDTGWFPRQVQIPYVEHEPLRQ